MLIATLRSVMILMAVRSHREATARQTVRAESVKVMGVMCVMRSRGRGHLSLPC